jgi:hypothetical protein
MMDIELAEQPMQSSWIFSEYNQLAKSLQSVCVLYPHPLYIHNPLSTKPALPNFITKTIYKHILFRVERSANQSL